MYIVKSIVLQSNAFVISHVKPKSEYGMFKIYHLHIESVLDLCHKMVKDIALIHIKRYLLHFLPRYKNCQVMTIYYAIQPFSVGVSQAFTNTISA